MSGKKEDVSKITFWMCK